MLFLDRDKAIDYFVDEAMFNLPRIIWQLTLLEVFDDDARQVMKLTDPLISSVLRYLFATLSTDDYVTIIELDHLINTYLSREGLRGRPRSASEKTIRRVREIIVGYEKTDKAYNKLLKKNDSVELRDYINKIKQKRSPQGLGWFMAISNNDEPCFCIYPFDNSILPCREEKSSGNDNKEQRSTKENIIAVWTTAISVDQDIRFNGNEFSEQLKGELHKCSKANLVSEAFHFFNRVDPTIDINDGEMKITPLRMVLANKIRKKLREEDFDDETLGLYQRMPLNEPNSRINWPIMTNLPDFEDWIVKR